MPQVHDLFRHVGVRATDRELDMVAGTPCRCGGAKAWPCEVCQPKVSISFAMLRTCLTDSTYKPPPPLPLEGPAQEHRFRIPIKVPTQISLVELCTHRALVMRLAPSRVVAASPKVKDCTASAPEELRYACISSCTNVLCWKAIWPRPRTA